MTQQCELGGPESAEDDSTDQGDQQAIGAGVAGAIQVARNGAGDGAKDAAGEGADDRPPHSGWRNPAKIDKQPAGEEADDEPRQTTKKDGKDIYHGRVSLLRWPQVFSRWLVGDNTSIMPCGARQA